MKEISHDSGGERETAHPDSGRSHPRRLVPALPPARLFLHNPDSCRLQSLGDGVELRVPRAITYLSSFQSAKKLYKHREASPFLNSRQRLPRMFYNAQFSFLFYFFRIQTVSQACQECFGVFFKEKKIQRACEPWKILSMSASKFSPRLCKKLARTAPDAHVSLLVGKW